MTHEKASSTTTNAEVIPFPHINRMNSRIATFIYRYILGAQSLLSQTFEVAYAKNFSLGEIEILNTYEDYLSKLLLDIEERDDFKEIMHMKNRINAQQNEYAQLAYYTKALGLNLAEFINMHEMDNTILYSSDNGADYYLEKYVGIKVTTVS